MPNDYPAWVVHEAPPDRGLPIDPPLGTVSARDKYDARREARRTWPGKQLVVQLEGAVMTRTGTAKPRPPKDYAQLARWNQRRRHE